MNDPDVYLHFMNQLTAMERRGMTTNKALKTLKKDRKSIKRYLALYRLQRRDPNAFNKVL